MLVTRICAIAISSLILSACYQKEQENETAYRYYGSWYNYETSLGIRYRDDTDAPERGPDLEQLDAWYIAVNECVGVWVDPKETGLFVIRTTDIPVDQANGYYWTPGLIAFMPRDQLSMERMTFKHEVLHHVLWHTAKEHGHESPLFHVCAR